MVMISYNLKESGLEFESTFDAETLVPDLSSKVMLRLFSYIDQTLHWQDIVIPVWLGA